MMMNLLRDTSANIQFEAFHVFKVFVANPKKPDAIAQILLNNRDKLVAYLKNFQNAKGASRMELLSSMSSKSACCRRRWLTHYRCLAVNGHTVQRTRNSLRRRRCWFGHSKDFSRRTEMQPRQSRLCCRECIRACVCMCRERVRRPSACSASVLSSSEGRLARNGLRI